MALDPFAVLQAQAARRPQFSRDVRPVGSADGEVPPQAPLVGIPKDGDDPGYFERQLAMSAHDPFGRSRPEPDAYTDEYGLPRILPGSQVLQPGVGVNSNGVLPQPPLGPPAIAAASTPKLRVLISWGRDPKRVVAAVETVPEGDLLVSQSVTIDAFRQLAPILRELTTIKDLTGGEWEEEHGARNQSNRAHTAARSGARASGVRGGGSGPTASGERAGRRRSADTSAAASVGPDSPGPANGRADAADTGSGVPDGDAGGGGDD